MTTLIAINQASVTALRRQLREYGQHLIEGGSTALWADVVDLKDAERVDDIIFLLFQAYVLTPIKVTETDTKEALRPEFEAFAQLCHACLHELLVHYRDKRQFALNAWERIEAMLMQVLARLQTPDFAVVEIFDEPLRDFLLIATDTGFQMASHVREEIRRWMESSFDDGAGAGAAGEVLDKTWKWHDPFLSMINQVSEGRKGVDEFDCFENIENQMTFLPLHTLGDVFLHGLSFDRTEINEIIPLMALHACEDVALVALETLENEMKALTPLGLRRLVTVRNWLPASRHAVLDRVIRHGRKQHAAHTQEADTRQDDVKTIRHLASTVDGSGAQNIMTLVKSRHGFKSFVGVVKENIGWVDVWSSGWTTRVECERIFRSFQQSVYTLDVTQDYIEFIFRQGLSWSIESGIVPKPNFLLWVELVHDTQVNPRQFGTHDMCYLLDLEPDTKPTHFQIRQAMDASSQWLRHGGFAVGWFEAGDHVEEYIATQFPEETEGVLEHCVYTVFEPLREKWHQRLLRLAFWAHCNAKRKGPKMIEFFAIASLIQSDLPLEHIPLMRELAMATLSAYAFEREGQSLE